MAKEKYDFDDPTWDRADKLAIAEFLLGELETFNSGAPEAESLKRGRLLDPFGNDVSYLLAGEDESLIVNRVADTAEKFRKIVADLRHIDEPHIEED